MQQQLLDIFTFNTGEIIAIIVLLLLFAIQLYFYIKYYSKPCKVILASQFDEKPVPAKSSWFVSVIISSENEVMRLSKLLPWLLEKDYRTFEVIVIKNGSTDEPDDVIESLKLKYDNLYCTYIPFSNDKDFGRRKLAYTLGAKAAKGDVLMFTEPHSIPVSSDWITLMPKGIDETHKVVLGSSYFVCENVFFNRISRYE